MKLREDVDRKDIRKREHKSLMKSLTMAQISTASMGKFDRKLKKEPTAPTSQTIQKKKSNQALFEMEKNRGQEKNRNMKVLEVMQKKRELALGGKINGNLQGADKAARKPATVMKKKKKQTGKKNWEP